MPGSAMVPAQTDVPAAPAGVQAKLRLPCGTPTPLTTGMTTSGTSPGSSPTNTALTVKLPVFVVWTQSGWPAGVQGPVWIDPEAQRNCTPVSVLALGRT